MACIGSGLVPTTPIVTLLELEDGGLEGLEKEKVTEIEPQE